MGENTRCWLARRNFAGGVRERVSYDLLFFLGIFAPDLRASLRAIATACLRLFTFLPLPDLSFPCLCSCITLLTFALPLDLELDFFVAINLPRAQLRSGLERCNSIAAGAGQAV